MPGKIAPKTRMQAVVASTRFVCPRLPPGGTDCDADAAPCAANKLALMLDWRDAASDVMVASKVLN